VVTVKWGKHFRRDRSLPFQAEAALALIVSPKGKHPVNADDAYRLKTARFPVFAFI
jgi:hypothetical protein